MLINPGFRSVLPMEITGKDSTLSIRSATMFSWVDGLSGETFREVATRRTFRFSLADAHYFAKVHKGVGWPEIFKNLLFLRLPILGARNEWRAIEKLNALSIDTMTVAAFAERGRNPARKESFIITEALENTISLEDFCADWADRNDPHPLKRRILETLAGVSQVMHDNGLNHRDYYICHFLLDESRLAGKSNDVRLYLIDLHRAQIREKVPFRWRVKDISGLLFSALDLGLTRRDLLRFVRIYSGKSLRDTLRDDRKFWRRVSVIAVKMYLETHSQLPANLRGWLD